jgi:hypothetical protein
MSSANYHCTSANGSITLKSFSELATVLDLESLPSGPQDPNDDIHSTNPDRVVSDATNETSVVDGPTPALIQPLDLASVIAQLAHVSTDLESVACADARARERATVELAQYETLAAERQQAERALAEARSVRATAELLVAEAFTEQARVDAARHAVVARAAELTCTQLLAECICAADELVSRPHLARVLAERRRHEREHAEAHERAETERAARLTTGIAAARQAQREGRLDDARALLAPLARDFPGNQKVESALDAVRWQARHLRVAPAEEALSAVVRRPYRDDPRAAADHLTAIDMDDLPEDLARRIFGVWSKTCLKLVRQSGMHDPCRYSPATSRGVVFARRVPGGPYEVVSALGLSGWQVNSEVKADRLIEAARPLEDR